jgi:hypothetical protein
MHYNAQGVAELLAARHSSAGVDVTAAGAGDNVEVDGAWIDRSGLLSGKAVVVYTATLAQGETLSIAANAQDADDSSGTGAADYGAALTSTVVATGDTGGSTETGVVELDFDLMGARGFLRLQFTPDLSASGTDTAELAAVWILGGADEQPVTAKAN